MPLSSGPFSFPLDDASIERVWDWRVALKALASTSSINYFLDASNDFGRELVMRGRKDRYNTWNDIADEVDKLLLPGIQARIEGKLPEKGRRVPVLAKRVVSQIRVTAIERQLRPWHDSDFFLHAFEWLERGHLPCGGTSDFPEGRLLVF